MRELDTDALGLVARALGVGAPITATELVNFDDANLQQVLDVYRLVARARMPQGMLQSSTGGGGFFSWGLQNVHAGAGTLNDQDDVFESEPGVTTLPRYPSTDEIRRAYDIWLAGGIMVLATAGTANLDYFKVDIQSPSEVDGGVLASSVWNTPLVSGTSFDVQNFGLHAGTGDIIAWIPPRRLEPHAEIRLQSVASGAGTIRSVFQLAIVPRGSLPHFAV